MEKSVLKQKVEEVLNNMMLTLDYAYGEPAPILENREELVNELTELLHDTYLHGVKDALMMVNNIEDGE